MNRALDLLRRSLPARLSAAFLALSVTTLLLAAAVSYVSAERALQRRTLGQLAAIAGGDVEDLTHWISRQRGAIEFLAQQSEPRDNVGQRDRSGALSPTQHAALDAWMRQVTNDVLAATELRLVGVPGGRVLASTDSMMVGRYATEERYFELGRDSTFTQRLYESSTTGRPTLTVATPVRDRAGVVRGVLAAHLDLADLEGVLLDQAGELAIDVYLIDRFAQFVSAERFGRSEYRRGVHSVGIDSALAGVNGSGTYVDYSGRPVVGVWHWIAEQDLALLVETPQSTAFAPARSLLARTVVVGLLSSLLLTVGVVAITRRATRPILAVAEAAERVATGDFDHRAPAESEDEVGRLAKSFNEMTQQLQGVYGELSTQVATTRQALEEAQASRSTLQDLADHTTAIVVVADLDRRILLANVRFEELLGVTRGATVGRRILAVLPRDAASAIDDAFTEVVRVDQPTEREVVIATDTESHVWQATVFPLRDGAGATYALGLLATDLTERARAEEERRQSDASAQQAQKLESLGIMAGGIAHDFNNILGAVMGNADLALGALDDPAEVRAALEQVATAARRAADLTRQMLAYAGKASMRREVLDVRPLLTDVLALVKAAQPKKVDFVVEPSPEPLWVHIDSAQLSQVALNLLTNAAEAIGDGVGTVTLALERSALPPGAAPDSTDAVVTHWVRLRVEDDGEGMNEEVRRRLFEPFFTTKRSGRGLGLSAVRGIIQSAGGVLTLDTAEGRGSRFAVYLPEVQAPLETARSGVRSASGDRRGRVLVVDDEEALRRVCRRGLESSGLEVLEAVDGVDGIARYNAERATLDLVILDMTMPGLGGAEVLAHIRVDRPTLPVIIASGYAESDQLSLLPSDPHVRYLQKPFGIRMLVKLAAELLP